MAKMPTHATAGETILFHGIPMTRSSAYVLSYEASRDRAAATSAAFGKLVKKVNETPVPLAGARIKLAEHLRPKPRDPEPRRVIVARPWPSTEE
jgi:hypothetical protein